MGIIARSDLGLLAVLVAIDDVGSISLAAEKLNISQPTVSNSLKRLRELTGDDLFQRKDGQLKRTPHANTVIPSARKLVMAGCELLSPMAFAPDTSQVSIRFAATNYSAHVCIMPYISTWRNVLPNANFSVTWVTKDTIEDLRNQKIDFLFSGDIANSAIGVDLVAHELYRECYIGVMCRSHPLNSKIAVEKIELMDWLGFPHVKFSTSDDIASSIDKLLIASGHERQVSFCSPSHSLNLSFLVGSKYLYAVPLRCRHLIDDNVFSQFEIPMQLPEFPFYLIYSRAGQMNPGLKFTCDMILTAFNSVRRAE